MKERIKAVRKAVKKTQTDFGADLNLTKSTIQSYEYGECNISDRTIKDICRIYNVNETWLRTGEGEMFAPTTREQELAAIAAEMFKDEDNSFKNRLIKAISHLNEQEILLLEKIVEDIAKEDN